MATLLYANGIIEELVSNDLTFTEEELINIFFDFKILKSKRLNEIPNSWCLWGQNDIDKEVDYNRIGSDVIDIDIFSPMLIIHDSELNPEWNIIDDVIYKDYDTFKHSVIDLIDSIAESILKERAQENTGTGQTNIVLDALGISKDKRLLFGFNPEKQNDTFYGNENYLIFMEQIYNYLLDNFIVQKPFIIYADNKIIVSVEDKYVNKVVDNILEVYSNKEDYEACSIIKNIKNKWDESTSTTIVKTKKDTVQLDNPKPKRKYIRRKLKSSNDNDKL